MTFDRQKVATHEAAHVGGQVIRGRLPKLARCDHPCEAAYGTVEFDWSEGVTIDSAGDFVISTLLGPWAADEPNWPPAFPPDRTAPGDEGSLGAAVSYLKLDRKAWEALLVEVEAIAKNAEFREMVDLVARALILNDTLTDEELRRLLGPRRLERFGIETAPTKD